MTGSATPVPYDKIISALRDLCDGGGTGTMLIATDDNRAVRVGLDHGEIVALVAGTTRDEAAVSALQAINGGSYSFKKGLLFDPRASDELPDTERLLAALEGTKSAPSQAPRAAQGAPLAQAWEMVEREAVDVIGPIARVLCAEHRSKVRDRRSLEEALGRIAAEIHDPDRARELRTRVMKRLGED